VVAGSNPATPTTNLASNPPVFDGHFPKSVNKPDKKVVNTNESAAALLNDLHTVQLNSGLSDRSLAKKIGVSHVYLSYIKSGRRNVTPAFTRKVLAALPELSSCLPKDLNFSHHVFAYITVENMKRRIRHNIIDQIEDLIISKQVEGKTPATLAFYRDNLRRFTWWLNENSISLDVKKMEVRHLRAFLYYIQTTPKRWQIGSISSNHLPSLATVDAYWRVLQALFSWLVREEVIKPEDNPVKKLSRPKVAERVVQDIPLKLIKKALLTFDENTLIGARNRAILLMLLDTGMRLSECADLNLPDIDLGSGIITVWGKGNKQRLVCIGKTAKRSLRAYFRIRGLNTTQKVWIKEDGKPMTKSGIQSVVRRLRKLGGNIRWSPHTFRNTFSMNYLRQGGDPFTLQILGGWKDLDMPRHYCAALRVEDAFRVHRKASPADNLGV